MITIVSVGLSLSDFSYFESHGIESLILYLPFLFPTGLKRDESNVLCLAGLHGTRGHQVPPHGAPVWVWFQTGGPGLPTDRVSPPLACFFKRFLGPVPFLSP